MVSHLVAFSCVLDRSLRLRLKVYMLWLILCWLLIIKYVGNHWQCLNRTNRVWGMSRLFYILYWVVQNANSERFDTQCKVTKRKIRLLISSNKLIHHAAVILFAYIVLPRENYLVVLGHVLFWMWRNREIINTKF